MHTWPDSLRFAFQPVVNLATGSAAALEILARPESGDVLARAHRDPELDGDLAALAIRDAARRETLLPLHVNVFAGTLADLGGLDALRRAVQDAGRLPWEVTVDVGPPFTHVPHRALLEGVAVLRKEGFRVCADGVGDGDVPLRLLDDLAPDLIKLDASLLSRGATVRAMRTLCEEIGALLAVEGVETETQCMAARDAGAQLAQGNLFAPHGPGCRSPRCTCPNCPRPSARRGRPGRRCGTSCGPRRCCPIRRPRSRCDAGFTGAAEVSGVLLVDAAGVPVRSVQRDRFLLSLSTRYGHALYADRPAARLGDRPRTVGVTATAWEVLDVVADGEHARTADDVAVVDDGGRCVGVVRLTDLVRALAESRVEEAAGLNPLTRLPGSDSVTGELDRWVAQGRGFALSWLDIDGFKQVNDGAGFAAGDELIRAVGRALARTESEGVRVGHIGGDDFLVLADPEQLGPLAAAVLDAPWSAGGRAVTLSLATVVCPPGSVPDHRQAAALLAPLKKAAKALSGASWVCGQAGREVFDVRRGAQAAAAARDRRGASAAG